MLTYGSGLNNIAEAKSRKYGKDRKELQRLGQKEKDHERRQEGDPIKKHKDVSRIILNLQGRAQGVQCPENIKVALGGENGHRKQD
jgi:hypothetical protein